MFWANGVRAIKLLFPTRLNQTPLNIRSVCERPACTLHNHEYEHPADSLTHGRPTKKFCMIK